VEGHSIAIEWRRDRGSTEQFPRYAAEVAGLAAKNATKTIPIVIATMEDPVQQGFSTGLAHPGGGITGLNLQTPALPLTGLPFVSKLAPCSCPGTRSNQRFRIFAAN
jgi:putative ABC transport system substrate-binding protein